MKKAKINLVYEERGRKRCRGNSSRSAGMTAKGRRNGVRATGVLSIIPDTRSMVTRSIAMQTMQLEDEGTLYDDEITQDPVEEINDDNKPKEQVQPQHEQQEEEVQPQHEQQEEEEVQPQHEQQEEEEVQPQHEQQEEEEEVQPQHEQQEEEQVQPQHEQQQEEQQQPANEVVPVPVENKGDGEEMMVLDDLPVICNYEELWPCANIGCASGWHYGWDPTNEFWEPFGDAKFEPVWDDALWDFKDDDETKKL
ncbi:hypothetical protein V6N13_067771 [Hibiscus sabdariffa]|uniref:Uncharacterized protein n=1 Tax=Hibiscus sabdariffa TaxID=183260 RepID=A0ABR2DUF1_9ROSI